MIARRPTAGTRIPVKLHRRVCLIQTEDAVLAEELLARKKLAQDIVGRLTDRVLLVRPGRVEAVVAGTAEDGPHAAGRREVSRRRAPLPPDLGVARPSCRSRPRLLVRPPAPTRWRRYDEALLRQVAARLVKPRNQWPVDDLIDRCVADARQPRRPRPPLEDLDPAAPAAAGADRPQPAAVLGPRQPRRVAHGAGPRRRPAAGLRPARSRPALSRVARRARRPTARVPAVKTSSNGSACAGAGRLAVFALPLDRRPRHRRRPRPAGPVRPDEAPSPAPPPAAQEADGLEWLLRLAVLWQQVGGGAAAAHPAGRLLQARPGPAAARPAAQRRRRPTAWRTCPTSASSSPRWPSSEGMLDEVDGELRAGALPAAWDDGLWPALESLWSHLPRLRDVERRWTAGAAARRRPATRSRRRTCWPSCCWPRCPQTAGSRPGDAARRGCTSIIRTGPSESLRPSRQQAVGRDVPARRRLSPAAGAGGAGRATATGWCACRRLGRWLLGLGETPPPDAGASRRRCWCSRTWRSSPTARD